MARRGEVWFARLDPVEGHEQGGTRPVMVLSPDILTASLAALVTVVPITSRKKAIRSRVEVKPPEGGLITVSYIICEQVRTISTSRLAKLTGAVSPETMKAVEGIVRMVLGL